MISPMATKNYSDEFRRQAVELYQSTPNAMIKDIAADLGVARGTLSHWIQTIGTKTTTRTKPTPAQNMAKASDETPEEKIARLEARVAELETETTKLSTEREILRRAAKYFAGETNW